MKNPPGLFENAKSIRPRLILILLLYACLGTACFHAPAHYRPQSWIGNPIDMKSIATAPHQSLLQVIIVYGPAWGHHSALRLICQDRPVLFWDPGGSYGVSDPEVVRDKDLIQINAPDLERYLQFTWQHSSAEVEVFEWDLTREQALELYEVLVNGADKNHGAKRFHTFTLGGLCTVKLSDFLHRFATKIMVVPKSFFFPENLAHVLYSQSPKRVLSFRPGHVQKIYHPLQGIATFRP
jgi:hypothetical protein